MNAVDKQRLKMHSSHSLVISPLPAYDEDSKGDKGDEDDEDNEDDKDDKEFERTLKDILDYTYDAISPLETYTRLETITTEENRST